MRATTLILMKRWWVHLVIILPGDFLQSPTAIRLWVYRDFYYVFWVVYFKQLRVTFITREQLVARLTRRPSQSAEIVLLWNLGLSWPLHRGWSDCADAWETGCWTVWLQGLHCCPWKWMSWVLQYSSSSYISISLCFRLGKALLSAVSMYGRLVINYC